MASFSAETREPNNGCDTVEVLEIDGALLMSQLLDESHVDDCDDDERLTSVIQSLEDEIKPITLDGHDFLMEFEWDNNLDVDDCNFPDGGQIMDEQVCSNLWCDDFNYNWMDMEDMKTSFNYLDSSADGMDGVIEFSGVREYYDNNNNNCLSYNYNSPYANCLEEHSYGSLWQDTNALLMGSNYY